MICYGCGEKVDASLSVCPNCGVKFRENVSVKDEKRNINKKFLIVGLIIFIIIVVVIVFSIFSNSSSLNKKNEFVKAHCDGESYVSDVMISDIVDNYECSKFASYMIDTKGSDLTDTHIDYLTSISNMEVYKIYNDATGIILKYLGDKNILDPIYYDYLYEIDDVNYIDEKKYEELILSTYRDGNLLLYKSLLRNYFKDDESPYFSKLVDKFGGNYIKDYVMDDIKKDAIEKEEFILEYCKYDSKYYLVHFFNKNLFDTIPSDKIVDSSMYETLLNYSYLIPLEDIKKYRSWGGKFYYGEDNGDIIDKYLDTMKKEDKEYEVKFKYLVSESKKDGYEVAYSDALEDFISRHYFNVQYSTYDKIKLKKIYRILADSGFNCYRSCSDARYFK